MADYFGYCNADGTNKAVLHANGSGSSTRHNDATTFTCPGSGSKNVVELTFYCKKTAGSGGNIRMAVFSTDLQTLYAQGSAQVAITNESTYDWYGHIGAGNITQSATLTGGTNYVLAICRDNGNVIDGYYDTGAASAFHTSTDDFTETGFSAPLPTGTDSTANLAVRCGVEAALSVPTLTTEAADDLTPTTATLNGTITDTGGEDCTAQGFVYDTSTHADPGDTAPGSTAYADFTTTSGTFGAAAFDDAVTGLTAATTYYVRSWAQNSAGYAYGDEETFATLYNGSAYGEETPDADEEPKSWSTVEISNGVLVDTLDDADWGQAGLGNGTPVYGQVEDAGDITSKVFTLQANKYGAGVGTVTLSIRGSETVFTKWAASPTWAVYGGPVVNTWRYVQVKIEAVP